MRMPDRLQFSLKVEDAALPRQVPALALLTLVENAVRHGMDPRAGNGTGLANLRARLLAMYGESASLQFSEIAPHGVLAEVTLPNK